ncbi:MAG: decaprenyl-phosphate phosphoribosyltransferase, partial [Myxococcota bacterium]|nr:decaprenyl-phosphate phosphoribosyltransferase [Myxococcota bacterium]
LRFFELGLWIKTAGAVAAFCCFASCGYLVNDLRDREADRQHPKKRKRPIASGRLPVGVAWAEAAALAAIGVVIGWWVGPWLLLIALLYFVTTLTYSIYWKHIVILDIMFLSAGFLWRAAAGAVAINEHISPWLLLVTGFVSLFLGFNKRRGELAMMGEQARSTRPIQEHSSHDFVVELQSVTTSGTIISYALYTVLGSPTPWMLLTLPYLLYGIFRYMYLVTIKAEGGAPEETLFKDLPILVNGILYGVTVIVILALHTQTGLL